MGCCCWEHPLQPEEEGAATGNGKLRGTGRGRGCWEGGSQLQQGLELKVSFGLAFSGSGSSRVGRLDLGLLGLLASVRGSSSGQQ